MLANQECSVLVRSLSIRSDETALWLAAQIAARFLDSRVFWYEVIHSAVEPEGWSGFRLRRGC
jgi:hypothetical protein